MNKTIRAYVPPFNSPVKWRECDAETQQAILHYHDSLLRQVMTGREKELVRDYLEYYVNAPCWQQPNLAYLRERIKQVRTYGEIFHWIRLCRDAGLDPLPERRKESW